MEFGLSEDQKLLQESIRGTLERVSPLERVRAAGFRAVHPRIDDDARGAGEPPPVPVA